MKVRARIERLEEARGPIRYDGPLPLHVLTIIMKACDADRLFTAAERQELNRYRKTIERIVARDIQHL